MRKYLLAVLLLIVGDTFAQPLYFPPLSNTATWDTVSPASLGWCGFKVDSLYNFLGRENTKAFILLKDGKIVLEKYFGTFTQDSLWYWASAGKTITSFLTGKAQEEGYLSINDTSSKYLGQGWTNCTPAQEAKIKIRNQLTMTTGLDDGVPDNHCTIDTCLNYQADAGTRWAYHNGPYTMLDSVIRTSTGQTLNNYTTQKLKLKTGMTGTWIKLDYDNVFFSKARSMVRFGLLIQNDCIWNTDTLLHDTAYKHQMVNTSQNLNKSYGYLWWLNGKSSFMVPTSQFVFPGAYAPDAPADMIAALGKNGQFISIAKSKGLLFVRMGEAPSSPGLEVPFQLCNQIWQRLNALDCTLPLYITSFTAKANDTKVNLRWTTENEINSSHFNIMRSSDGTSFKSIGTIPCNLNQINNSYTFADYTAQAGVSKLYYRLQQFDKDGTNKMSATVIVDINKRESLKITPNPASNHLSISGKSIKSIQLFDGAGKLAMQKNISGNESIVHLDVATLARGLYVVKIQKKEGIVLTEKILLQ